LGRCNVLHAANRHPPRSSSFTVADRALRRTVISIELDQGLKDFLSHQKYTVAKHVAFGIHVREFFASTEER
jgi:hypothetical protein